TASETPEFVATLSPEGLLQMRGRLRSELGRSTAETFAKARFGAAKVYNGARLDQNLPAEWPVRVLAGLGALAQLSNGALVVSPDQISISGNTGNSDASAEISRMLVDKLGDAQRLEINVTYQEALDPVASLPTAPECESQITEILKTRKINFEPGSSTPVAEAGPVLDDIADVLKTCGDIKFEIGGHTDSQGREEMNQQLSQARAQAVLGELRVRRVLNPNITAMGYGEAAPIADNGTEDGRETNRRIEFKLITPAPIPEVATTLESAEQDLLDQGAAPQPQAADTTDAQTLAPEDAGAEQGSNDE
ncbi:MAG: OmpA family protein, partial [Lutimaribacter sp.]